MLSANDQISDAIAVDVTGAADGIAVAFCFASTIDNKAAAAGGDIGEFDWCCICGAKDDIGVACPL